MAWLLKQGRSPQHTVSWTNRRKEQQWRQDAKCSLETCSPQSAVRDLSVIRAELDLKVSVTALFPVTRYWGWMLQQCTMGVGEEGRTGTRQGTYTWWCLPNNAYTAVQPRFLCCISVPDPTIQLTTQGLRQGQTQNSLSTSSNVQCLNKVSSARILKTGHFPSLT